MANEVVGVDINVKTNVEGSIGQLKALKKQLKDTAAGSDEFKRLTNQIDDLEDKLKGSKQAAGDWVDQLASAPGPLGAVGNALNKLKVSTQSFGGALKATGIGLFVAAIAGLIAAFAESEKATKKLQPLLIGFEKIFNGIYAAVEPLFDAFIDLATKAMPIVTKSFGVAYSAITSFLQGIGSLGNAVSKLIKGDFSGAWDSAKEAVTGFGKRYSEANERFIAGTKEVTKTEKEELDKRKEAADKAAEEDKKRKEAQLQRDKTALDELKKIQDENYLNSIQDETERAKAKIKLDYDNSVEEIKQREISESIKTELLIAQKKKRDLALLELDLEFQKKQKEIDDKALEQRKKLAEDAEKNQAATLEGLKKRNQERIDLVVQLTVDEQTRELADLDNQYQRKRALIAGNEAAETALTEEWERKKAEVKMKYEDMKIAIVQNALNNISNIVGKETIAGKALAVASATIDTYQAANKALKADYGIFGPAAQVARFISVAATIGAGIKNIKEIVKVKVPGNAGGTSVPVPPGVNSAAAPITPSAPLVNTRTQLDSVTIQQLGSATNRAYVLESDITNNQERIRRINRAARLG